ncbi:MAG: hypothetical protein ACJAV9_000075 [Urechidicola sp.]|jgi:hypothetical protein
MIEILLNKGYTGLGHIKDEDVAFTLQKNLQGIQALFVAK